MRPTHPVMLLATVLWVGCATTTEPSPSPRLGRGRAFAGANTPRSNGSNSVALDKPTFSDGRIEGTASFDQLNEDLRQHAVALGYGSGSQIPIRVTLSDRTIRVKRRGADAADPAQWVRFNPQAPLGNSAAAGSFALHHQRLLGQGGPDPCHTDARITSTRDGYTTNGLLHRANGRFWVFCPGARHTWEGHSIDIEGVIRELDSDPRDPLVFEVSSSAGYVYRHGRGTLVLATGERVSLPPAPGASLPAHYAEAPPSFSAPPTSFTPPGWPRATATLVGHNELRIRNPNPFNVRVGVRSNGAGVDFVAPAMGVESVHVPNGHYQIFFIYSNEPEAVYEGDEFALQNNGVEIRIVQIADGNYGIRRVR